jgi:putative hydrolase of the HAD superfamily
MSPSAKRPFEGAPDAVTFDCWNTLLYEENWQAAHALRVAELHSAAAEAGHVTTPEEATRAFDAAWLRHMELWRQEQATGAVQVARWSLEILGIEPRGIPFDHLVHDWQEASHTNHVEALAGARHLLQRLRGLGIRTALICDTGLTPGRVVRRHLERKGLLELLEVQIFSDEVGVPKPHPRMFHAALAPLRVPPERCVHVGDLRRTDVAGGRGVGMGTVRLRARFDDHETLPEADAVADTHAHLGTLLGVAIA